MDLATHIPFEEFPILGHGHYANHAAIAPWPRAAARAVAEFARENAQVGAQHYSRWLARESRLRVMLARLLNADSGNDIALLKNTTEGICTVANGIDWRRGDNLVLPADEFPSNRLPWLALRDLGVEVREVDIRAVAEPEQALLERIDSNTRLLSVSAVHWTDGLRLQLEKLGSACQQNSVLFFVDAIQQLGALQLDVKACNIDCLAADGHKWLLAPEGIAVFYCNEDARDRVGVSQRGWHMVDEPYRFARRDWQPTRTAGRYEAGSPNTLGQAAMCASVGLLQAVGMTHVEDCVMANTSALWRGLSQTAGVEPARPPDPQRISNIVSFVTPGQAIADVYQRLQKRQVSCALRGGAIRLSPHFYQVGNPLDNMLDVIIDSI